MEKRFSDPEFEQVEPGSYLSYPCSPTDAEDDVEFRGIRLRAPAEVYFAPGDRDPLSGTFAPVIVCGMCCVSYETLGLRGDFVESIVLVAVDARTQRTYSGRMVVSRGSPAEKPGPEEFGLTDEDLKDRVIVKFFNPNLAEVLELPEAEAEYLVHATLGPYQSNVVRIRVVRRKAAG